MAASVASVGCKVSASLAASSSKLDKTARPTSVTSAFGLKPVASRVSCSLEENVRSIVDGAKAAAIVLASSALVAGAALAEGNPARMTYDEMGEDASEERQLDMRLATDASEERQWEGLAIAMAIATPALLLMLPQEASAMEEVLQLAAAELDPSTAKLAINILGPLFAAFNLLFIVRIVMSWYPQLPVGKFPFSLAYAPTEPVLGPTRRLIPPVGGVDVAPVIWVALMSFLNEILLGQQGLLVLLSQQQP